MLAIYFFPLSSARCLPPSNLTNSVLVKAKVLLVFVCRAFVYEGDTTVT